MAPSILHSDGGEKNGVTVNGHHQNRQGGNESTLAIIGCGALGTAILSGILLAKPPPPSKDELASKPTTNGTSAPTVTFPTRFLACVRRPSAVQAVQAHLGAQSTDPRLQILNCQNLSAITQAQIILLACQPHELIPFLSEPDIKPALANKLIISVLAGITPVQILSHFQDPLSPHPYVIKTMPNTASLTLSSATVLELPPSTFPPQYTSLTTQIFSAIGRVFPVPAAKMDTCTALCGSSPAFFATFVDALADSAVALGLERKEAEEMAAQAMMGAAGLILNGKRAAEVRGEVASPGGSTIQGLLEMEEGRVRAVVGRALRVSANGATGLGRFGE